MDRAAKRARPADPDDASSGEGGSVAPRPADTRDHLTESSSRVLTRCLADFLGSPFDWRFLRAASTRFGHLRDDGPAAGPLARSVEIFRAELRAWDASKVYAEASKDAPDGDRVLFALRMRHLVGRRPSVASPLGSDSRGTEMMLDAIKALLKKPAVLGWPPVDERCPSLDMHDPLSDEENDESNDSDNDHDYHCCRLTDRGAVELIVTIMERWPGSTRVQEKGCFLLSKLWGPRDLNQRCVLLVRHAMDRHLGTPKLQGAACQALRHFWFSDRRYLLSVEPFKAVCAAMEKHTSSLRVQRAACEFFEAVLPRVGRPEGYAKVFEEIRDAGVMKLMLIAVTMHIGRKWFQRDAWILITKLLRHVEGSSFFGCGGVPAMSKALSRRDWGCSPDGRVFVLDAFRWACTYKESARHIDEHVMQLALSLLIKDPCIVYNGVAVCCFKAFGHLAQVDRWAAWLAARGAAEHIVRFMERSLDFHCRDGCFESHRYKHPEYTASALALTRLIKREPLQVDGALRAVTRAMAALPGELKLQGRGCEFLASLGWSPLNAVKASAFRACGAVLGAMGLHAEEEEALQAQGCLALATLLAHEDSRATAAKLNGVGILVQAMERFPSNAVVCEKGRWIIRDMSKSAEARRHSAELRLVALLA